MSEPHRQQSNFGGNSAKSLHVSVEQSLRKLQTNYIDLLYVHYWDLTASVAEVMQSLNHLVFAGKVLYLGVSDTPAWYIPLRSISDISLYLLVLVLALIFILSVRLKLRLSRWGYQEVALCRVAIIDVERTCQWERDKILCYLPN